MSEEKKEWTLQALEAAVFWELDQLGSLPLFWDFEIALPADKQPWELSDSEAESVIAETVRRYVDYAGIASTERYLNSWLDRNK